MVLVKEGLKMKKHLSLDERFDIENSLCKGLSFKEIARNIGKDCTTISREIRNHYIVKNTGGIGRQFNNCIYSYKYIDLGLLNIRNIDLPRKVRFRKRTKQTTVYKIDKNCLKNRTYEDFKKHMEEHPDTPVVEMDSVEGKKGGKVLLTIHFVNCSFMLAFIREHNDAQSVIDTFNYFQDVLGLDKFKELFVLILTDNGSEFSNPIEIEFDMNTGEKRTQIFYCHPSSPFEKGSCEVNHELLRRILPKGTSFDDLNQDDINLIMSHINSYKRKKLNNVSPYTLFSTIYGKDTIDKLGIQEIEPNKVSLSRNLLKK